jgi:FKBP-type peptidyl-prolyl cis-trans isomerase FklB
MLVIKKSVALLLGVAVALGLGGCNGEKESAVAEAPKAPLLQNDVDKFSYSVGVLMATDMKNKGISALNEVAMGSAIRDVIDGKPLQLNEEQMEAALEQAAQKLMEERLAKSTAAAAQAKAAGEAYLAANQAREGVVTLPSGIQYKVLTEGSGAQPTLESTVVAHYHGTLIDGTVFDSSYERGTPATFALARVVKGWQEVLPLMTTGSKWQVAIPSELAYGETGAPPKIGGNETLLFDIELVEIQQPEAQQ